MSHAPDPAQRLGDQRLDGAQAAPVRAVVGHRRQVGEHHEAHVDLHPGQPGHGQRVEQKDRLELAPVALDGGPTAQQAFAAGTVHEAPALLARQTHRGFAPSADVHRGDQAATLLRRQRDDPRAVVRAIAEEPAAALPPPARGGSQQRRHLRRLVARGRRRAPGHGGRGAIGGHEPMQAVAPDPSVAGRVAPRGVGIGRSRSVPAGSRGMAASGQQTPIDDEQTPAQPSSTGQPAQQLPRGRPGRLLQRVEPPAERPVGRDARGQPARLGDHRMLLQEALQTPQARQAVVDHHQATLQDDRRRVGVRPAPMRRIDHPQPGQDLAEELDQMWRRGQNTIATSRSGPDSRVPQTVVPRPVYARGGVLLRG